MCRGARVNYRPGVRRSGRERTAHTHMYKSTVSGVFAITSTAGARVIVTQRKVNFRDNDVLRYTMYL